MQKIIFHILLFFFSYTAFGQATVQGKKLKDVPEKINIDADDIFLIAENNIWRQIKSKNALDYFSPSVLVNPVNYLPTSTGNTLNLNKIFTSLIDGKRYFVDNNGTAVEIGSNLNSGSVTQLQEISSNVTSFVSRNTIIIADATSGNIIISLNPLHQIGDKVTVYKKDLSSINYVQVSDSQNIFKQFLNTNQSYVKTSTGWVSN